MKTIIIDNGTKYLPQLLRLTGGTSDVISYLKISEKSLEDFSKYDAVILSGGHSFPVVGNEARLGSEIELLEKLQKPIFGICYGFELIANTFGAKLEKMEHKERGILDIEIITQDKLFKNVPDFKVFESHRWVVKETSDLLLSLAKSRDGIEAIRHKDRPIFGVQFHPEMFVDKTCGDEIYNNFIKSINI